MGMRGYAEYATSEVARALWSDQEALASLIGQLAAESRRRPKPDTPTAIAAYLRADDAAWLSRLGSRVVEERALIDAELDAAIASMEDAR